MGGPPLPGGGRLPRRRRPLGGRAVRRRLTAQVAALAAGRVAFRVPPPGPRLLPAAALLVHRGPRPPLGLGLRDPAVFVALLDVLGLAFLLARVTRLVAAWHRVSPVNR